MQALVSILSKSDVDDISKVDKFNPAIRAATLGELEEAISIIKSCGLVKISKKLSKTLVDSQLKLGCKDECWRSVDSDRFEDMVASSFMAGVSFILFNKVEILQVCYKVYHPFGVYHLQSILTGQVFGVFSVKEETDSEIMEITKPTARWVAPRSPTQTMPDSIFKGIRDSANKKPVSSLLHIHKQILEHINIEWGSNFKFS